MMDSYTARRILADCQIYRTDAGSYPDYHALDTDRVLALTDEARERRYRKPRLANGSRSRSFYEHLTRTAVRGG